nr:TIGR02450 family Trp-rich protein [Ostreibacterium oceani]
MNKINQINPNKLLNSKWTAVTPINKEKHFLVSDIEFNEAGAVVSCCIEAVISKRVMPINWQDLQNESLWIYGWK